MTGPSAIGSENGTPSSTMSAPAATRRCRIGTVIAGDGSPAVTYGMSAVRPAARRRANVESIRLKPGAPSAPRRIAFGPAVEPEAGALRDGVHVLVAATGEVDEQDGLARQRRREL